MARGLDRRRQIIGDALGALLDELVDRIAPAVSGGDRAERDRVVGAPGRARDENGRGGQRGLEDLRRLESMNPPGVHDYWIRGEGGSQSWWGRRAASTIYKFSEQSQFPFSDTRE